MKAKSIYPIPNFKIVEMNTAILYFFFAFKKLPNLSKLFFEKMTLSKVSKLKEVLGRQTSPVQSVHNLGMSQVS